MLTLFPDTNLFIQCKDLRELPWNEIGEGDDILIMIPRAVQKEIDNFKNDGNSRRAKRARKTISLLKQILNSSDSKMTIIDASPRIEISLNVPSGSISANLNSDEQIIEEVLAHRTGHSDQDVKLLSNDIGLNASAKINDIPWLFIPDHWLLPPEPDERDKRISELEKKNLELECHLPQINIKAHCCPK